MSRKILVVDDEALARRRIIAFLEKESKARGEDWALQEASDGVEALEKIASFDPDLVYLDVQMPELTGFDVLRNSPDLRAKVVFQTAFDEFAIRAFEVNACDYLLKPFTDERLRKSLERAFSPVEPARAVPLPESLDRHLSSERSFADRFVIKAGNRRKIIPASQIEYFLSENHMTRIFAGGTDYAYDLSLNRIQERLDPERWLRIHRNALVPVDAIASFTPGPDATVVLKGGAKLAASREGAKLLKKTVGG
jgi:two-component system LytT family response regulator